MKCKNCGKILNDEYVYCPWCGQKVISESEVPRLDDLVECTLGEIFDLWKKEHYPVIGKKGIEGYSSAWNRLSSLKDYKFQNLKTMHYQMIIDRMTEDSLSRASTEKVQHLVSQLCKYAIKNDLIDRNYGMYLTLPKMEKCQRQRFSDSELDVLWKNSSMDQTVQIILILAYTGLRVNELFSLRKENIYLNETIPYIVGGSKTEAGRDRSVVIFEEIMPFIESAYRSEGQYLFTNKAGNPINLANWRKRHYYPTLDRLGIQRKVIHCLRHTFASMMIKSGADSKSIAQMMGHTKISTTADIYAHADLMQLSQAIQKLPKHS